MRIGSLFSGIGGLELGLERAGVGAVAWQCEILPGCREVLAHHWPDAVRFDDIRGLHPPAVDLICGGFPCQDVSSAGKRAGLSGTRSGLWYEYLRVVSEVRPRWVVVENVASGAHAWASTVLTGLGELGYTCLPVPLSAADVGAPHLRRRIFVIAYLDLHSEPAVSLQAEVAGAPQPPTHADHARREGAGPGADQGRAEPAARGWGTPQPRMVRVVHGVSRGVDRGNARPRIAALGNSVVPQCAEVIGHIICQIASTP